MSRLMHIGKRAKRLARERDEEREVSTELVEITPTRPLQLCANVVLAKAARRRRRAVKSEGVDKSEVQVALAQSRSAIASIRALVKTWGVTRWSVMRNLSMSAAVDLRMQSYLLRVVASVFSMCFAGEPRGSALRCYTIDAQKFDETKHYLAPVGNATGRRRFMVHRPHRFV